ncbi:ATP-binding protein [Streptomyces odontomachi]|uniref:ATP-binding protein n=1 Tax=Streptomyces odontomachi TaxID=2944940 RepID=UPI00210CF0B6|nr:ATP-binding protein [Streptomyces sp. ODS25]
MTQTPTGAAGGAGNAGSAERGVIVRTFRQRFSSTPLGARLARHLALHQLERWGIPHGAQVSERTAAVVAELAANAATHGRVPGRDFELVLTLTDRTLRIDVSDTRTDRRPPDPAALTVPAPLAEDHRGLVLVAALATRWQVRPRPQAPGKTVSAELDLTERLDP